MQPELLRELHRSRNTLASVKAKAAAGFVKQPELKLSNRAAVFRTFQQSREIISGADRLIEGFGRIAGGSATDATLIPKDQQKSS